MTRVVHGPWTPVNFRIQTFRIIMVKRSVKTLDMTVVFKWIESYFQHLRMFFDTNNVSSSYSPIQNHPWTYATLK